MVTHPVIIKDPNPTKRGTFAKKKKTQKKDLLAAAAMDDHTIYVSTLVGGWIIFWNISHLLCYLVVPLFALPEEVKRNRNRLSLRVVGIVHAVVAYVELYESITMGLLRWPPKVYDLQDNGAHYFWYAMGASYYMWDLVVSLWVMYGYDFVLHALISFPVFFFGLSQTGFCWGFYGRFFHGVFALTTPWLHLRELSIASGNTKGISKMVFDGVFAATFVVVRMVGGTVAGSRFLFDMASLLYTGQAHWPLAVAISALSCGIIMALQLYWGRVVVIEVYKVVVGGGGGGKNK